MWYNKICCTVQRGVDGVEVAREKFAVICEEVPNTCQRNEINQESLTITNHLC